MLPPFQDSFSCRYNCIPSFFSSFHTTPACSPYAIRTQPSYQPWISSTGALHWFLIDILTGAMAEAAPLRASAWFMTSCRTMPPFISLRISASTLVCLHHDVVSSPIRSSSFVGGDSGVVLGYMLTSIQPPLQDGSMLIHFNR